MVASPQECQAAFLPIHTGGFHDGLSSSGTREPPLHNAEKLMPVQLLDMLDSSWRSAKWTLIRGLWSGSWKLIDFKLTLRYYAVGNGEGVELGRTKKKRDCSLRQKTALVYLPLTVHSTFSRYQDYLLYVQEFYSNLCTRSDNPILIRNYITHITYMLFFLYISF